MGFALRKDLYFCIADGRLVFLDVPNDRYFLAPPRMGEAFIALLDGHPLSLDEQRALSPLLERGFLVSQPGGSIRRAPARPAAHALIDDDAASTGFRLPLVALARSAHAELLLRSEPLGRILEGVARSKAEVEQSARPPASLEVLKEAAGAFLRVGKYFRGDGKCLRRSIAFVRHAHRLGVPADIVIGVHAVPFEAHAWVQHEGTVLNDSLDQVRTYTPVLVL